MELKKVNFLAKPINNHVIISDKNSVEWFISELSKPLTTERIIKNQNELKKFTEYFFNGKW